MHIVCHAIMLRIDMSGDFVHVATGHSESKDLHRHFTNRVQARVMQNYNYSTVLLKEFCFFCEFFSNSKTIIIGE